MPFVGSGLRKKDYLLLVGFVGTFYLAALVGTYTERDYHRSSMDPEAQVLLKKATFDPRSTNPNDTLLWSAFLPQAKICDNCNALEEFDNRLYNYSRPLVFQVNGDEVGNPSIGYTMVLGVVSQSHETGHQIIPRIIYYIGHQNGSLARIDESGNVEYRYGSDEWRPVKDGSAIVSEVRQIFQQKWQQELASPRTQ